MLLTNTSGFSAHVEEVGEPTPGSETGLRGQLVGSGPNLFFAPEMNKRQKAHGGNFLFIWNVAQHKGYVLSEALQAYAPVSSNSSATNVIQAEGQVMVRMSDGTVGLFQVVKSKGGFPVQITSMTNSAPMTVVFSQVRMEQVSGDLFMLPDGFSSYPTPEALADELAARQRNFRRKPASDEDFQNLMPEHERKQ